MKFFHDESCGQCTPCRVGTAKALALMEAGKWDQPFAQGAFSGHVTLRSAAWAGRRRNPALTVMRYSAKR